MGLIEAVELLKRYNEWRRWSGDMDDPKRPKLPCVKEIGIAIDTLTGFVEQMAVCIAFADRIDADVVQ